LARVILVNVRLALSLAYVMAGQQRIKISTRNFADLDLLNAIQVIHVLKINLRVAVGTSPDFA
jgi:hypothetical protein